MSEKNNQPVVIALGYFDSVHIGHKTVIDSAKNYAVTHNYKLAVFTFGGNLKGILGQSEEKSVYLPSEREKFLRDLGADEIFFAPVTKEFLDLDKNEFLHMLNEKYDIRCYVSGDDYTFGKFGKGNVKDIKLYAEAHNQAQIIVDMFKVNNEKVSTSLIKEKLLQGDVSSANKLLGRNYSVTGKVIEGRKVGRKIGFPTININIESDKFRLKDGVYAGKIQIDNSIYDTIINYGACPTFNVKSKLIEAYIIDFDRDLYGREITIEFTAKMRDIYDFGSAEELKNQLKKDVNFIRKGYYD